MPAQRYGDLKSSRRSGIACAPEHALHMKSAVGKSPAAAQATAYIGQHRSFELFSRLPRGGLWSYACMGTETMSVKAASPLRWYVFPCFFYIGVVKTSPTSRIVDLALALCDMHQHLLPSKASDQTRIIHIGGTVILPSQMRVILPLPGEKAIKTLSRNVTICAGVSNGQNVSLLLIDWLQILRHLTGCHKGMHCFLQ